MSTYTSSLGLEQITPGDQAGLWGNTTNNNLALIDQAVTGVTPVNFAGLSGQTYTLTDFDGAVDESRSAVLNITGIAAGSNTIVIPNKQKMYLVRNNTGQNVVFQTPTPTTTYTVGAGNSILIFCNGNNEVFTGIASPSVGTLGVAGGGTGSTTFTAGFVKSTGGTNALTSVSAIDLNSSDTTNTLPVTKGGTGLSTIPAGAILRGAGTANPAAVTGTIGVPGQVLTWNGSQWEPGTPSTGVASFSGGVTGLTPATTTTGAITLGGTLEVTSGGTGSTNQAGARANLGIGSVGVINTNGSTTQFLRGDGVFATPPASGGTVTSVSGAGSVSGITLTGTVTSAGSLTLGGSLSLSSGQVTSALGYSPVPTSGTGATGTWPINISGTAASASTATTASSVTNGVYTNATNNFTGANNYSTASSIDMSGSSIGDLRLKVAGAGMTSGMSPSGVQLGASNWGFVYGTFPDVTVVTGGAFTTAFRQSGNFQSNNSPNWATTSDINIKTNFRPINNALGKITSLNPCHFEYKDEIGKTRSGFIAQEFVNVFPGHTTDINVPENYKPFVPEGVDKLKTLDLNLIPYLVKAIKELKTELDEAKAEIAALKAK